MGPTDEALKAVGRLQHEDKETLLAELGRRLQQVSEDPKSSALFNLETTKAGESIEKARSRGTEIWDFVQKRAHDIICGKNLQDEDLEWLDKAFHEGRDTVVATSSLLLISYLGLAPSIAVVVAMLAVELGYDTACELWSRRIAESR